MSGNVSEWNWDWEDDYPDGDLPDYRGVDDKLNRVGRGGNWGTDPPCPECEVATRSDTRPRSRYDSYGFRLVRPLAPRRYVKVISLGEQCSPAGDEPRSVLHYYDPGRGLYHPRCRGARCSVTAAGAPVPLPSETASACLKNLVRHDSPDPDGESQYYRART